MAIGRTLSSRGNAIGGRSRPALRAAILAVLFGVGACSPVEAWRDLTGASKNDPNPATTPNTSNLAAGEASGYPNLATVPPPPTDALTAAQLSKLAQSLTADRIDVESSAQKLRAVVVPGTSPAGPGSGPAATVHPATAMPPTAMPPTAMPPTAMPPTAMPPTAGTAPPAPTGPVNGPAAATVHPATAVPPTASAAPPAPAGPGSGRAAAVRPAPAVPPAAGGVPATSAGERKPGQPPEPGPMESSLVPPEIGSLPEPERFQPGPPPPRLATAPAPHLPPPLPQLPAAPASASFRPPPPPVEMIAPAAKTAIAPPLPAISTPIGEIKFAADATGLSDSARLAIGEVAARYKRNPAKLRVLGYAAAGSGAAEQLNGYRAALDRAQTVASALTKAGVPANKIMVEASPASAAHDGSRIEIQLEH